LIEKIAKQLSFKRTRIEKLKKLENENNPVANIQSNNVLRNCNLRSMIPCSHPSKLQALRYSTGTTSNNEE
jgi:hypothetical protein